MGGMNASSKVREVTVGAVVRRADGSVEDLGVIAAYHSNVLMRWWAKCKLMLRGKRGRVEVGK